MIENNAMVTVERTFEAPINLVWQAISEKESMKAWYFDLAEFMAKKGYQFEFTGGPSPDRQYVHLCQITEVIPERELTYNWRYKGYKGTSLLTFMLFEQGDQTLLKLTHSGLDSFPAENSDFAIDNFREGWNHLIHIALTGFLESK